MDKINNKIEQQFKKIIVEYILPLFPGAEIAKKMK